jgi:hypothetical protein
MLTYDDAEHRYFWHGVEVPSLSALMSELGWARDFAGIPEPVMELARTRGLQVHAAIDKYLAKDAKFVDELSEASAPFFDSFLAVVDDLPLTDGGISELPVGGWCGYGTTPDRVEKDALIEWKAVSRIHPSVFIQLAGQEYALQSFDFDERPHILTEFYRKRMVVHLLKTGKKARVQIDKEPEKTMAMWRNDLMKRDWKLAMKW